MKRIVQFIVFATFSFVSSASLSSADAQALPENWHGLDLYDLEQVTRGRAVKDRADIFAGWMAANDWRTMKLELHDLYNLYSLVNADSVDRRQFSARWTGFLTAPSTGTYTLRQVRQYSGPDSRVKVTINGQTVLDTTGNEPDESQFTSNAVQLTAGEPVAIHVAMTHIIPRIEVSEGAPMVVVTWKLGQADEAIIPSSALTPPEGFDESGGHGLKGEYFADLAFNELKSTRLDPALDIVSTWPPIAPIHQAESRAVFDACKAKVMDDAFLAVEAAKGPDIIFRRSLWRIAYRMRAIERQQLAQKLLRHRELLAGMTPGAMARVMQAFYMLPGKEHLNLIGEWALAQRQPRYQVLDFPIAASGRYENTVYDDYWRMGHKLQGPYWNDAATLWDEYLVRPNGECNLPVAYMTAYSTREESSRRDGRFAHMFIDRIQQALDDETVTGDKRVTWLLARVFVEEVLDSSQPVITPNSEFLSEARLVAESGDYKFWTLQEIAARYASLGDVDNLDQAIGSFAGDTPEERAAVASWREKAASIAAANAELRADELAESSESFLAELKRRLAMAQQHQDQAEINRYQALIESADADGSD